MQYRMFNDGELRDFRAWMRDCPFDRSVQGAFDSKPRRARDDEPEESRGFLDAMLDLKAKMSPAGFRAMCMALCDEGAEDDDPAGQFASPMDREMHQNAQDEPADFPGKPKTGGGMVPLKAAMDGRMTGQEGAYFSRLAKPQRAPTSKSFEAMYPGAAAIKVR